MSPQWLNITQYDTEEDFPLLMPRWGYVASAFALFLIGFFGFFLNLFVIIIMCKDRKLWTPLNIILFNLVCSDFSVSILGNPFTLISALYRRWVFGRTMCVMYGFFMGLLGITSITTLTVLSFERYMLISRPFSQRRLTSRGAIICVLFIWIYSLALTVPPLVGWGNYINEAADISCSINWEEQTFNTLTYILFLFAFAQVIPIFVIGFSYLNIVRTIKQQQNLRRSTVSKAEARVSAMVFIMIIAFMVAWTPYSILALIKQFATHDMVTPGMGVVPALVAKSSICYNPLIYVGMNTQFITSVKKLFGYNNIGDTTFQEAEMEVTVMSPARGLSQSLDHNTALNCTAAIRQEKKQKIVQRKAKIENLDEDEPGDSKKETAFTEETKRSLVGKLLSSGHDPQ